ncbi:MAG: hypothetical protein CMJ48_01695 [Planctomycetaceae bacterium]|nr:hypothetical protein [Planctomycetaceae bacterium]
MNCYLCGDENLNVIRQKLRYDISRNVLRCGNCGVVYLQPREESLEDYYCEDYRKKHSPILGEALSSREIFEYHLPFQGPRVERLRPVLTSSSRVLDIGCSAGHFLHSIREQVHEVVGAEFNKSDAAFVNEELGIKTYTEPLVETDLPKEHFDIITMFHVLEHIDDPITFLETTRSYLKPGGHIYVEVPNLQDAMLSLYEVKEYADFWFREPHIFYFSAQTLSAVLEKSGYSGRIQTAQRYSLLNHLSWQLTRGPQKTMDDAMRSPALIRSETAPPEVCDDLNEWFRRVDQEYRALVEKHGMGDSLFFLGQPQNRDSAGCSSREGVALGSRRLALR